MSQKEAFIIADDITIVTKGLETFLTVFGHQIIAIANSVEDVQAIATSNQVQLATAAIIDVNMPTDHDGETAAKILTSANPGILIISLTSGEPAKWGQINLEKTTPPHAILQTIAEFRQHQLG